MWVDVTYYDGYAVSDQGEVVRKDTGVLLKKYVQKNGYEYVWLKRGKCRVSVPVHRIVCTAYHGEGGYINGLYVDHINTIRSDNRSTNLRWVTPKENANNPLTITKRRGKKTGT